MPSPSMKKGLFSDPLFNRKLVSLAVPIALQSLMLAAVAAADAIMLGRLNQNSMAAVSLATQIQFVMNMFLSSVVSAGSILGSQYWGKQDLLSLHDIFNLMLRLSFLIDLLFGLLCILTPGFLMAFFTNDPTLSEIGVSYLRIAGWSYLLTGISQCYLTIMKLTGHANRTALISSSAVILNIVLNTIFIFGLIGFPEMGARGAALATLISRIVELAWAAGSSLQKGFVRPDLTRLFHRNRLLGSDFRKISLPLLGASLLWGIGFTSYSAIMGHLGQNAAAANSVAAVVRDLTCCMCNGIANAGSILLGNQLGQGNLDMAKIYGQRLMKLSFLIGFITTAVVLAVIHPVLLFYRLTPNARTLCAGMLAITSFYMIGRCVNTVVINGIFDAGGDTKFDVYSLIVVMWGIAIPVALCGAFLFHWPVLLVYACTCLDEVGKIPWVIHHFHKYRWLRNLTR
ncbi:MATE family efflux transporter [Bilifractor sp. LCP21S3_A7]|uniref:MATE family efflux transporter n=1 Tax=Bilifractor sp. LCP21S3_A7 TaxID=3438738 RepID=UPI003F8F9FEF